MVSAKMELAMVGTSTPTERVRELASGPELGLGTYPSTRMASWTRARVEAVTSSGERTTRLTVMGDTPARAATSARVAAFAPAFPIRPIPSALAGCGQQHHVVAAVSRRARQLAEPVGMPRGALQTERGRLERRGAIMHRDLR